MIIILPRLYMGLLLHLGEFLSVHQATSDSENGAFRFTTVTFYATSSHLFSPLLSSHLEEAINVRLSMCAIEIALIVMLFHHLFLHACPS